MDKSFFINTFVANFVAAWCAQNYDVYCLKGWHEKLYNPPIEDAYDMAEEIWKKMKEASEKHLRKLLEQVDKEEGA